MKKTIRARMPQKMHARRSQLKASVLYSCSALASSIHYKTMALLNCNGWVTVADSPVRLSGIKFIIIKLQNLEYPGREADDELSS